MSTIIVDLTHCGSMVQYDGTHVSRRNRSPFALQFHCDDLLDHVLFRDYFLNLFEAVVRRKVDVEPFELPYIEVAPVPVYLAILNFEETYHTWVVCFRLLRPFRRTSVPHVGSRYNFFLGFVEIP